MINHELSIEIVQKKDKKTIKISNGRLEVDKGDTIKWKRKNLQDNFQFTIIFPDHSPFKKNEFKMETRGNTGAIKVIYDPDVCGWKKFKYSITASDGSEPLLLDPELIIPKNP